MIRAKIIRRPLREAAGGKIGGQLRGSCEIWPQGARKLRESLKLFPFSPLRESCP